MSQFKCNEHKMTFKNASGLGSHMNSKYHGGKGNSEGMKAYAAKMKNATKRKPKAEAPSYSKLDLISILQVKINALQDVIVMLENL